VPASAQNDYEAIAAEITDGHEIVASKLFGMPTLKVRGKAFAGLFGEAMSFKLSPADLEAALAATGGGQFRPERDGPADGRLGDADPRGKGALEGACRAGPSLRVRDRA